MSRDGDDLVRFERRGALGLATLDRPRAINALTGGMIDALHEQLHAWADDDAIETIAIRGAGDRGLCAGGDVASLVRALRAGDAGAIVEDFFRREYRLNHAISQLPKPYVALMDGIVLGGGVGVSAHGSHRIVTERSRVGMPETGIGLFPDVGGTRLLSHAPDGVGVLMGLTGIPVGPGDAIRAGLADAFVPGARLEQLLGRLESEPAADALAAERVDAPAAELEGAAEWTRQLAEAPDVGAAVEIIEAAARDADEAHGGAAARAAAEALPLRSPTSLAVTFAALRRAAALPDLAATLVMEYRLVRRLAVAPEFAEGVRAQLIDKDRTPVWSPATLAEVDAAGIEALFAPHAGGDLDFEGRMSAS